MLALSPLSKVLAILCLFLTMLLAILGIMYKSQKAELKSCEATVTAFVTSGNNAAVEANKSAGKIEKEIRYIVERSKPNIIYIDTFKGEPNATKCDTATSLLGNYRFN